MTKLPRNFVQRDRGGKYEREVNRHEIWVRSSNIHLVRVPDEWEERMREREYSRIFMDPNIYDL